MASSARIDELRKKFEENPRRYFAPLANEYRKAGETDQAIAICREYLPQQPGHMSGHIVFGQALYEARQFEEAKAVFETALTLDPENLIALRHLGDIALILGDTEGARVWYRRVLEADPRNEEIQSQLASLDQAASQAPTPALGATAVEVGKTPPVPPAAPTPSSAPTVVMGAVPRPDMSAARPPTSSPAVTATSPTAEIVLEELIPQAPSQATGERPATSDFEIESTSRSATIPGAAEQSEPPVAALEGLESTTSGREGAPIDGFSLEGLETTSMAGEPPADSAAKALPELELGTGEIELAAASETPAVVPVESALEPSSPPLDAPPATLDLDLGALATSATAEVASEATEPAAPVPELQQREAPPPVSGAPQAIPDLEFELPPAAEPPLPTAHTIATQPSEPGPQPVAAPAMDAGLSLEVDVAATDVSSRPADDQSTSPFVTETMAELYLQQGHRDEALRVYRALLEQRPDDVTLQDRVARLSEPAVSSAPPPGQGAATIRQVLRLIATRRPGFRPEPLASNGVDGAPPAGVESLAGTHEDVLAARLQFGAPTEADDRAAMTLATAFASNGAANAAATSGAPARAASSELTLDTVFGEPPPRPSAQNFSFDQFFSQRASAELPVSEPGASPDTVESKQDVAQFNEWLEGLKRR